MKYTALDPSKNQIRVLYIHPGKAGDDLACHFSVESLDNHELRYEALSYVWGTSTEGHIVCVDGSPMPITDNLWQALTGLRSPDKERILWVDALCINQTDVDERSEQVSHMNAIYSQASCVEIWLGESYVGIDIAFRFLEEFATGLTAEGETASWSHLEDATVKIFRPDVSDKFPYDEKAREVEHLVSAMATLAQKPWFDRVWTIQEYFLANKSTFHCGRQVLDGAVFMEAMYHFAKHSKVCCTAGLPGLLQHRLHSFFLSSHAFRVLRMVRMNFLDCVSVFRFRKATNPRDKIYGLLGLGVEDSEDVTALVRPNYALTVEEIFESFVIALLHQTGNLNILSHLRNERRQSLALPTFVPDWSLDLSDLDGLETASWSLRCGILDIYDAASGRPVEYEARPGVLRIRGLIVDVVRTMAQHTIDSVHYEGGPTSGWNDLLDEQMHIADIPPREEDPGLAKREAFWLALLGGSLPEMQTFPTRLDDTQATERMSGQWHRLSGLETTHHEGYEDLLRNLDTQVSFEDALPDTFVLIDYATAIAQRSRKFMRTHNGLLGLIPTCAKEGDVVAVLTGGHVPFILRPHEGYYTVVGDAYVHNIMDGEAFRGVQSVEELEYIELR